MFSNTNDTKLTTWGLWHFSHDVLRKVFLVSQKAWTNPRTRIGTHTESVSSCFTRFPKVGWEKGQRWTKNDSTNSSSTAKSLIPASRTSRKSTLSSHVLSKTHIQQIPYLLCIGTHRNPLEPWNWWSISFDKWTRLACLQLLGKLKKRHSRHTHSQGPTTTLVWAVQLCDPHFDLICLRMWPFPKIQRLCRLPEVITLGHSTSL